MQSGSTELDNRSSSAQNSFPGWLSLRNIFGLVVLLLLLISALTVLLMREPKYKGISLSHLMFEGMPEVNGGEREDRSVGIRAIGTKALPHYLNWLQAHDSTLKIKFMELLDEQSMLDFSFHSADEYHMAALTGFDALGPLAQPAIPQLTKLLQTPDVGERAAHALALIGGEGDEILASSLTNGNPVTRNAVAAGLRESGKQLKLSGPLLVNCLGDSQPNVRAYASQCIADMQVGASVPSDVVVPILLRELQSTNLWNNLSSISALGKFPDHQETIAPELMKCLTRPDLRTEAAESLQELHVDSSLLVSNLIDQVQNGSQDARRWAALMLGSFKEQSSIVVPELTKIMQSGELRRESLYSLRRIGAAPEVMLPFLIEDLKQPGIDVRMRTARMIASFGNASQPAVPALLKAAEEQSDTGQKLYFLEAVLKIDSVSAEANIKLLNPDYHDPGSSLAELTRSLSETNSLVRRLAVFRMGALGAEAKSMIPTIQGLFDDPDQRLRFEARMALRKIDPDSAPSFGNQIGYEFPQNRGIPRRR